MRGPRCPTCCSGGRTSDLLDDSDPAVRVCAALSPAHVDRPRALAILLDALRDPRTTDGWFPEPLPCLDGWFRFTVLRSALVVVGHRRHRRGR